MTERPILMNGAMVRATLAGIKTQTRRVMKPQPSLREGSDGAPDGSGRHWWPADAFQSMVGVEDELQFYTGMAADCCPYGARGDGLRVRETFFAYGRWVTRHSAKKKRDEWHFIDMTVECDRAYQYDADAPDLPLTQGRGGALPGWHRRPAIFMPRTASRILLEIVSVRMERLNDCNEADARAEGVIIKDRHMSGYCAGEFLPPAVRAYRDLWDNINGAGSWEANPWVWVIDYRKVMP